MRYARERRTRRISSEKRDKETESKRVGSQNRREKEERRAR